MCNSYVWLSSRVEQTRVLLPSTPLNCNRTFYRVRYLDIDTCVKIVCMLDKRISSRVEQTRIFLPSTECFAPL